MSGSPGTATSGGSWARGWRPEVEEEEQWPWVDRETGQIHDRVPVQHRPVPVWEWNKAIMAAPEIIGKTLAVGFVVGTFADSETGESVFPAAENIGRAVGIARQKVYPLLNILERCGYIARTGLDTKATAYRLTLPVGVRTGVTQPLQERPSQVRPLQGVPVQE